MVHVSLIQADGIERVGLRCETEGDVLAVEFGETGFRQVGNQLIVIAFVADVREDQMLRVFSKEVVQRLHRLGIAEVSEFACDAPFEAKRTVRSAKSVCVVVGFQHEQIASAETLFYGIGNKTEVGGDPDLPSAGGKRESHGGRVMRDGKGLDLDAAKIECGIRDIKFHVSRYRFFSAHYQSRFRHKVDRDTVLFCENSTSRSVVIVRVGHDDCTD